MIKLTRRASAEFPFKNPHFQERNRNLHFLFIHGQWTCQTNSRNFILVTREIKYIPEVNVRCLVSQWDGLRYGEPMARIDHEGNICDELHGYLRDDQTRRVTYVRRSNKLKEKKMAIT